MAKKIYNKFGILGEGCFLQDDSIEETIVEKVSLKSAEILTLGTAKKILGAPGLGKFYEYEKFIFKFTHKTTAYTLADPYLNIFENSGYSIYVNKKNITSGSDRIEISGGFLTGVDPTINKTVSNESKINAALFIQTSAGNNPTLGDGILTIEIYYKIHSF
jgi:hypothetical protein